MEWRRGANAGPKCDLSVERQRESNMESELNRSLRRQRKPSAESVHDMSLRWGRKPIIKTEPGSGCVGTKLEPKQETSLEWQSVRNAEPNVGSTHTREPHPEPKQEPRWETRSAAAPAATPGATPVVFPMAVEGFIYDANTSGILCGHI